MKKALLIVGLMLVFALPSMCEDFTTMTKLWCTMNYKHWAVGYANSIGYQDVNFYLYLDDENEALYDEQKRRIDTAKIGEREITYATAFHADKRNHSERYIIDRYSGKATVTGTIRHDYGRWATFMYENRDFEGFGQCAQYSEVKKF